MKIKLSSYPLAGMVLIMLGYILYDMTQPSYAPVGHRTPHLIVILSIICIVCVLGLIWDTLNRREHIEASKASKMRKYSAND